MKKEEVAIEEEIINDEDPDELEPLKEAESDELLDDKEDVNDGDEEDEELFDEE
jgi:hypothetical protein